MKQCTESTKSLPQRHAHLAKKKTNNETDPARKAELLKNDHVAKAASVYIGQLIRLRVPVVA